MDLLLNRLNTITDFVDYLNAKDELFSSEMKVLVTGEEDLLGRYLRFVDSKTKKHHFNFPSGFDLALIEEGEWESFVKSSAAISQEYADRESYLWDQLIEKFSKYAFGGGYSYSAVRQSGWNVEQGLRHMASEPRTPRRFLADALKEIVNKTKSTGRGARLIRPTTPDGAAYVFLALAHPSNVSREDYRETRMNLLRAYCEVVKLKLPDAKYVVGIATEPGLKGIKTEDFVSIDLSKITAEDIAKIEQNKKEFGLFEKTTETHKKVRDYPNESARPIVPMDSRRNKRNCTCSCGSGLKFKNCCGRSR